MDVDFIQEFVMNQKSPWYGKARSYRVEYGGHAEECIATGRLWVPVDITEEEEELILNILRRIPHISND